MSKSQQNALPTLSERNISPRQAPSGYTAVREGQADVLIPKGHTVFYNKIQEFNRDISIHVLNNFAELCKDEVEDRVDVWRANLAKLAKPRKSASALERMHKQHASGSPKEEVSENLSEIETKMNEGNQNTTQESTSLESTSPKNSELEAEAPKGAQMLNEYPEDHVPPRFRFKGLRIFEALSASGLRSVRYWKEVQDVATIHANDLDPAASVAIRENIRFNEVPLDRVIPTQGDATKWMYMNRVTAVEPPYHSLLGSGKPDSKVKSEVKKEEEPKGKNWKEMTLEEKLAVKAERKQREDAFMESIKRLPNAFPTLGSTHHAYTPFWNVIDLDPYGSAAPFIDSAVQAIDNGGLLCITCTDMSILCGNHAETCFVKYGGMSMSNPMCHELGLRILLNTIELSATRYQRHIKPLMSLSIDYYCRVWVRVFSSPNGAKATATKRGLGYVCTGCRTFSTQRSGKLSHNQYSRRPESMLDDKVKYTQAPGPSIDRRCDDCGSAFKLVGPMWLDPIHDVDFVNRCLESLTPDSNSDGEVTKRECKRKRNPNAVETLVPLDNGSMISLHNPEPEFASLSPKERFGTFSRMQGMLQMCASELNDVPFYYSTTSMSNVIHCRTPHSQVVLSALVSAGYRVSETHCSAGAFKTDAPSSLVWDIMRHYVRSLLPDDMKPWTVKDPGIVRAMKAAMTKHKFAYRFEDFLEKEVFEWTEEELDELQKKQDALALTANEGGDGPNSKKRVCVDSNGNADNDADEDVSAKDSNEEELEEDGMNPGEEVMGQKRRRCAKSQKKNERRLTRKAALYAKSTESQTPLLAESVEVITLEGECKSPNTEHDLAMGMALVEADTSAALRETDPSSNTCKAPLLEEIPLLTPPQAILRSFGAAPGAIIIARKRLYKVDLTERSYEELGLPKIRMFFGNPEKFWGPKARAGSITVDAMQDE